MSCKRWCRRSSYGFLDIKFFEEMSCCFPHQALICERLSQVPNHACLKALILEIFWAVGSESKNWDLGAASTFSQKPQDMLRALDASHYRHTTIHENEPNGTTFTLPLITLFELFKSLQPIFCSFCLGYPQLPQLQLCCSDVKQYIVSYHDYGAGTRL